MTTTIINAQIYTMHGEVAYQIDYSEGTKVRAVESIGKFIRSEYFDGQEWKASCKPYIVDRSKKRNAERIKDSAEHFLH